MRVWTVPKTLDHDPTKAGSCWDPPKACCSSRRACKIYRGSHRKLLVGTGAVIKKFVILTYLRQILRFLFCSKENLRKYRILFIRNWPAPLPPQARKGGWARKTGSRGWKTATRGTEDRGSTTTTTTISGTVILDEHWPMTTVYLSLLS